MENSADPDQTAPFRSSLVLVCNVSAYLFVQALEILRYFTRKTTIKKRIPHQFQHGTLVTSKGSAVCFETLMFQNVSVAYTINFSNMQRIGISDFSAYMCYTILNIHVIPFATLKTSHFNDFLDVIK